MEEVDSEISKGVIEENRRVMREKDKSMMYC